MAPENGTYAIIDIRTMATNVPGKTASHHARVFQARASCHHPRKKCGFPRKPTGRTALALFIGTTYSRSQIPGDAIAPIVSCPRTQRYRSPPISSQRAIGQVLAQKPSDGTARQAGDAICPKRGSVPGTSLPASSGVAAPTRRESGPPLDPTGRESGPPLDPTGRESGPPLDPTAGSRAHRSTRQAGSRAHRWTTVSHLRPYFPARDTFNHRIPWRVAHSPRVSGGERPGCYAPGGTVRGPRATMVRDA